MATGSHVAPSYGGFTTYNTLRIRPEYRISLRMGEIDKLFPWPIDSIPGRLARMQVLGLFYWPLKHRVAAGKTAKPPGARLNENQAAYREAWKYFKKKFCKISDGDLNKQGSEDKAQDELKKRLEKWVVQRYGSDKRKCSYNSDDSKTEGGGELPLPAPEDEAEPEKKEADGYYAKIRLPGGWSFFKNKSGHNANEDISITGMEMYDSVYNLESKCYEFNSTLGKIPLIATVEKRVAGSDNWEPAPAAQVYFQLLKPYTLPKYESTRRSYEQLNRPDLIGSAYSVTHPKPPNYTSGNGPEYFMGQVWDKYDYDSTNPDHTKNPQANNCHVDCGGKRKTGYDDDCSDVAPSTVDAEQGLKNIFWVGHFKGFTESNNHGAPAADFFNFKAKPDSTKGVALTEALCKLPEDPELKLTEQVTDTDHPHSVKAKTNAAGEAGVIFMPSRCAGDRYRIRAYVGTPTLTGDAGKGQGEQAVRVDTGTFVVWRNLRLSRFVYQKIDRFQDIPNILVNHYLGRNDAHVVTEAQKRDYAKKFGLIDSTNSWKGLPTLNLNTMTDGKWMTPPPAGEPNRAGSHEAGIRVAFAKGFCDFETDPGYKEQLKDKDWDDAVKCGWNDAKDIHQPADADANKFDLHVMLFRRLNGDLAVDAVKNSFIFPARNAKAYENAGGRNHALLTTGPDAGKKWKKKVVNGIFTSYLYPGFMRHISGQGYLPGVTVVQGASLTNLEAETSYGMGLFGIGTMFAGAFVMRGQCEYATKIGNLYRVGYGYTACVMHEVGHVIFKVHAPGTYPDSKPAAGCEEDRHDSAGNLTSPIKNVYGKPLGQPRHGTCVMSYRTCEGFFCSRCLLQLRGWNILANKVKTNKAAPLSFTKLEADHQYTALPKDINFEATAANGTGPYAYSWDFGDGTTSAIQNPPPHNYAGPYPGTPTAYYEATVQVTDSTGKSACGTIRIAAPVERDVFFPDYAKKNTDIDFRIGNEKGGFSGEYYYYWDFGDATPAVWEKTTKHKYANAGTYTVSVEAGDEQDNKNCKYEQYDIIITEPVAITNYTANRTTAAKSTNITFNVTHSGGSGTYTYEWDFGDGNNSTTQNPTHAYNTAGDKTVKVTVKDKEDNANSATKNTLTIKITEPVAITNYTANRTTAAKSTNITFNVTHSGGSGTYTYAWDFGDGNTSTTQNPTHAYNTAGDKTVKVTVKDTNDNANSATKNTLTVKITGPVTITYTASSASALVNANITFNVTPGGGSGDYTYEWKFGDGQTSATKNPTHAYNAAGEKTVQLTVKDTKDNANSAAKSNLKVTIT